MINYAFFVFVPQDLTLKAAETEAKDAEKGLWAKDASTHVRNVTWEVPDARQLVEQYRGRRSGRELNFFLFPFCKKSLICLEGKRDTLFSSIPPSNSLVSVSDP